MKHSLYLLILLTTAPAFGQGLMGILSQHQNSLGSVIGTNNISSNNGISTAVVSTSTSSAKCGDNEQTSLPLALVTALIQQKNGALEVAHDPRSGTLTITSADMVSNCSSMMEWNLRQQVIDGKHTYAVEVKLKRGTDCSADGCRYKVAKVENGSFKEYQMMVLKPNLQGFESCLEKSGVIADGKVQAGAIYSTPLRERFNNVDASGKVLFVSSGPVSAMVKARYGNYQLVNECDHFENINQNPLSLLSKEDEERQRLDAEAAKLKDCTINEYSKVADFLDKYEDYASELAVVRDRLIDEAAKKSAQAITDNKYTEDDLKVLADFDRYIVQPKIDRAVALYEASLTLEGDQKRHVQEELKKTLAEIVKLNSKPYFVAAHVQKLITDGRFDDAEKMNSMKLTLQSYARLGARENNVVITPQVAMNRLVAGQQQFTADLTKEKERYEIRTGQSTGHHQYWANLASRMRTNIQTRNENYTKEIQSEYARIQPGGYCYRYFRNTQRCIQESTERIQELQAYLQHYNKVDAERATEYDAKAQEYGRLEAEGRRHIAAQNGEVVEETVTPPASNLHPTPRTDNTVYGFDYQGGGQQTGQQQPNMYQQMMQNQFMPQNMFQQQQNPYQMYQQNSFNQQPQMGQQAYGYNQQFGFQGQMGMMQPGSNQGYSFNWNGGGQQQMMGGMPQQPGYWGQPHQAYNNYNMYGR